MLVLDTNVLSETIKPAPNERVLTWLRQQPEQLLFTTAITQAEIFYGVWVLPAGKRREALATAVEAMFDEDFHERVLGFDRHSATMYAAIMVKRQAIGRPIADFDAQIAAIARRHSATVVTRNVKDFEECGVALINPWDTLTAPSAPAHISSSL